MPADKRKHNCSAKCAEEWRCKTSPSHLRWLLASRDKGVCSACGTDTRALRKQFEVFCYGKERPWVSSWYGDSKKSASERSEWLNQHGIPYGRISSDWWDADHIVPVIEGGGECGIDNMRTLCIPCHKAETKKLRQRMSARVRASKPQVQSNLFSES